MRNLSKVQQQQQQQQQQSLSPKFFGVGYRSSTEQSGWARKDGKTSLTYQNLLTIYHTFHSFTDPKKVETERNEKKEEKEENKGTNTNNIYIKRK